MRTKQSSTAADVTPPAQGKSLGRLDALVEELLARQASGRIGYWASYADEQGTRHYAFTRDPFYASMSPENAESRAAAVDAFAGAIERYRKLRAGLPLHT